MLSIVKLPRLFALGCFFLNQCAILEENQDATTMSTGSWGQKTLYPLAAQTYLAQAEQKEGEEKENLLIKAARRLIQDGQWQEASRILTQINPINPYLSSEKNLALAKISLIRSNHKEALHQLSAVQNIELLPVFDQTEYHESLAKAYLASGYFSESIRERIKLERLLPNETEKSANHQAMWSLLTNLSLPELHTLAAEAKPKSNIKGWIELALIAKTDYPRSNEILNHLTSWESNYPNHPGKLILPASIETISQHLVFSPPKQIALILPLSGPLAGPGHAIEDGFLSAYRANGSAPHSSLRFYDSNLSPIVPLYHRAVAEGAEFIIGPLNKKDVADIAVINHPVPTLLLNDVQVKTTESAYQFGLSPNSEAQQIARKARTSGLGRALIIAPTGAWSDEIVHSFSQEWQHLGGHVVDTLHFYPDGSLNQMIKKFLHLSDSETRSKEINQLLGHEIEATPKRRDDFDMIFLLAYPSTARQILPLLRYYYAGDIPVYATSHVYSGEANSQKDKDLNGVIFCDMPWVFSHQTGSHHWPEPLNSYNRLYAMGIDAYHLSNQLNQLLLFPALGVNNSSGKLYLNANQHITRKLRFGQIKSGLPVMID